ncbi:MAG: hypothetical protein M3Z03_05735 [Actinomycetota bacterium]|nr:hypothetical protein [Actinomycetota bacterium]
MAQADDGAAGTASDGAGSTGTGDASAVGNQSGTNSTQTVTVSGNLGVIQVINQQANVSNVGVGVANTGGNIAIGNASTNNATAGQTSDGGVTGGASNNGNAANGSNGSALINTGNASAVGNRSNTNLVQEAHGSAQGTLGGILVINQDATVNNVGFAAANTGGNTAVGNTSNNGAGLLQESTSDGSLANNNGAATNDSNGKAVINSGNASATGNKSDTHIVQKASGSAGGSMGGLMIIDQDAFVLNAGIAAANTGGNTAVGNDSFSEANVGGLGAGSPQLATLTGAGGDIGVASNNGEASNWSDGNAIITTGDAGAVGNDSRTRVDQSANGTINGAFGGSVITQDSNVVNAGVAAANSGLNQALGNGSVNFADANQEASGDGFDDVGVVGNFGKASNASSGTGAVHSGGAFAAGNRSQTDVSQTAETTGGAFNLQTQGNAIVNVGLGAANSGLNAGVGNVSFNEAGVAQSADLLADGDPADGVGVGVIGQFGLASNDSDGTGTITTGDASAVGNDSETALSQEIDPNGIAVQTQIATVVNAGVGVANSGGNVAIGNFSSNAAAAGVAGADAGIALEPLPSTGPLPPITVNGIEGVEQLFNPFIQEALDEVGPYFAPLGALGGGAIPVGDATASLGQLPENPLDLLQDAGNYLRDQFRAPGTSLPNHPDAVNDGGVNASATDDATLTQGATIDLTGDLDADTLVMANNGEASNASDGTATIHTGNAAATGNRSSTVLGQESNASIDGLGAVINTQVAGVANVGVGVANSGLNAAIGNAAQSSAVADQTATLGGGITGDITATGPVIVNNSGTAANASDGNAAVWTGHAAGAGNNSGTELTQSANGEINGLGIGINTQAGGVLNAGLGVANSGLNLAVGNASNNEAALVQEANVVPDGDLTAGSIVVSNAGEASNASDGTAGIITGNAEGTGNTSETRFRQEVDATVDGGGAVINTQLGGVANLGLGVGNSGLNAGVGNISNNDVGPDLGDPGLDQVANVIPDGDLTVGLDTPLGFLGQPLTVSNAGEASNASDGTALLRTGNAQGQGNVSATAFGQHADGTIGEGGLGVVPNFQVGAVVNAGAGIANSGVNLGIGNAAGTLDGDENLARVDQVSTAGGGGDLDVIGPLTVTNNGRALNSSDGTAKVHTGGALATGNASATNFSQAVLGDVDGLGLVVGPQIGFVANVGVGVANSGVNASVGNLSSNSAFLGADAPQTAEAAPAGDLTVVGPLTVGNNGEASNTSDGFACTCTGNAVASGNVSTTSLNQYLDIGVDDGLSVVPTTGVILNAGFGVANSGVNLAVGNISGNVATTDQLATLDPGAPDPLVGPQTVVNSGGAKNASNGTGKVGTGNANGAGNISTSDLTQAIAVDGAGAFASVNGGITNVGAGVANSGINLGVGNASTNVADLDQTANGVGTVSNNGEASNSSDGFGGVGDPNCEDKVPTPTPPAANPTPDKPGIQSLPKTGGPLEVEAALGLMLLLAGFGFRRVSKRLS